MHSTTGWAVGDNGAIIKTSTGGEIIDVAIYEPESGDAPVVVELFQLHQNYPNPFNPTTTIIYEVAKSEKTIVSIYNILGKEIATLVSEIKQPGKYQVIWEAGDQPTGMYFVRMQAGNYTSVRKMMLLK